jgi:ssDNA-binding Zn-finger/Zn-ribbon topoisomerase 1
MSLLNQNSITNYWIDCPSCGQTKISSVLHDEKTGEILGARMHCPECAYVFTGKENLYVDETIYEIPSEWVETLQIPRWKCQQCGRLNEKPSDKELGSLTVDDLYCKHCETWQCDIPGTPAYDPNAKLRREAREVEERSRWENPVSPIELKQDKEKFEETYSTPSLNLPTVFSSSPSINKILVGLAVGGLTILSIVGVYDNTRTHVVEGQLLQPLAEITQRVEKYEIVTREGWNPNYSAPDFQLLSQEQRQNGTRQVPDGLETYFETERYLARYDTETYTATESERVQSGTRQECTSTKVGATSQQSCHPVPVFTTQSRPITKTRQVPVYETRQVEKTRQKYRTEPVYDTYYRWQQGVWEYKETLTANTVNFGPLNTPDTSSFEGNKEYRVLKPKSSCSVLIKPINDRLEADRKNIDCDLFSSLNEGQKATIFYSNWGGIKDIEIKE